MSQPPTAAVTGWGLLCALGDDPAAVQARLDAGDSGMVEVDYLRHLPDVRAAKLERIPVREFVQKVETDGKKRWEGFRTQLKIDELITRRYSLDEINQGYQDMNDGKNIRGIIAFD